MLEDSRASEKHFVVLGHMDPEDEGFWSGIPRNIVLGLRDAGHRVTTIGPLQPHVTLLGRIKGRLYRHAFDRVYLVNRDPAVARRRARQANRALRNCGHVDAVIVPYLPDAAYIDCPAPLILVHDATWHQLLDFYPGYERTRIAPETQAGGYEMDLLSLQKCDRAIYASNWAAVSAIEDYGINREKVIVLPLGAGFDSVPTRRQLTEYLKERGRGPCRLLFVGIDWHRKGGDMAIAVAERLASRGMAVELDVVGCHPAGPVPPYVRSFGYLSKVNTAHSQIISQLFARADFLLVPSRAECFGMIFNEAAAYGVPVAATKVGGIPEVVHPSWGSLFPLNATPSAFAEWIQARYLDREGYQQMAWAAREDFDERLNWGAFCRRLSGVVDDIRAERATSTFSGEPRVSAEIRR